MKGSTTSFDITVANSGCHPSASTRHVRVCRRSHLRELVALNATLMNPCSRFRRHGCSVYRLQKGQRLEPCKGILLPTSLPLHGPVRKPTSIRTGETSSAGQKKGSRRGFTVGTVPFTTKPVASLQLGRVCLLAAVERSQIFTLLTHPCR